MIRARVKGVRSHNGESTAVVEVKEVLKSSLVNIPKETLTLYYMSSCMCPPLTAGEDYLITGYENKETSRYEICVIQLSTSSSHPDQLLLTNCRMF